MIKTDIMLIPLDSTDRNQFILDNQEAFRFGSLEEFGMRYKHFEEDGEIISRRSIEIAINKSKGETYRIIYKGEKVGGVVLSINRDENKGTLQLLFVSPQHHSKGIGYAAWCAVERMHPEIQLWETFTPYFETRNIHFYVNRCGFKIVEYFNNLHPLPEVHRGHMSDKGDFRFEKRME